MTMVGFPLLLIPLAVYNIIAFLMHDVSFVEPIVHLKLTSGTDWPISLSDMLVALGILLLLLEVIKGARPAGKYLTDHLLSLVVFGAAAAEFVLLPQFGTSTYFLLALLALVDFLSGIALRARRRTVVATGPAVSRREARQSAAPPTEPPFEPVPAPAPAPAVQPAAPPVAEPVLPDHPQPKIAHPGVAATEPSPEIASPELQPGSGSPPPETPPR
jgi:hypothetical protein